MNSQNEAQRRFWDRTAGRYDALVLRVLRGRYESMNQRLREDLRGHRRVLELAAGTGLLTAAYAPEVGQVIATDFSEGMLEQLRARVRALEHVEIALADVYDLSQYEPASFDAVLCANTLHVLDSPSSALAQMHRVLAPGGMLLVPTFCHGETRVAGLVSRAMSLVSRFQARQRYTAPGLASEVAAAGFRVEISQNLGGLLPLLYLRALRPV